MSQQNNHNQPESTPPDRSTQPMASKQDVEKSPDEKTDQDFPGYPHYPSKEDIMDQRTDSHRIDLDVENLPNSRNMTGVGQRYTGGGEKRERAKHAMTPQPGLGDDDMDPELNPRTETNSDKRVAHNFEEDETDSRRNTDSEDDENNEANVSPEEVKALQDASYMPTIDEDNLRNARLDDTDLDGDRLNEESFGNRQTGTGLDMPEESDEAFTETSGQGDEENKYFSLGGDRNEGNEEDPYSGPERVN